MGVLSLPSSDGSLTGQASENSESSSESSDDKPDVLAAAGLTDLSLAELETELEMRQARLLAKTDGKPITDWAEVAVSTRVAIDTQIEILQALLEAKLVAQLEAGYQTNKGKEKDESQSASGSPLESQPTIDASSSKPQLAGPVKSSLKQPIAGSQKPKATWVEFHEATTQNVSRSQQALSHAESALRDHEVPLFGYPRSKGTSVMTPSDMEAMHPRWQLMVTSALPAVNRLLVRQAFVCKCIFD